MQSTGEIPAGGSSELGSDPCLDVARYAYSVSVNGEEAYRCDAMAVSQIDNPEAKHWDLICDEVWNISEG